MKLRSTFTITSVTDDTVFLVDQDEGMSVTNDAEQVVEYVNNLHPGKRIIYRDTEGRWDELLHDNGVFLDFAPYQKPL
jgi:hypothetical protein